MSSMRRLLALCLLHVMVPLIVVATGTEDELRVGVFSDLEPGGIPEGWKPMRFSNVPRETEYSLTQEDGPVVLKAESRHSASALIREVTVDSTRHPYLSWSWKTHEDCFSGSWRLPQTDDFPLRLFVIFERSGGFLSFFKRLGSGFSGDAILYVADTTSPQDVGRSSHLSDRIKVVPLTGPERTGRAWGTHVRNVRADYLELFGKHSRNVAAVAVMTDTDNSRTECVSYFGDIQFSEASGP